MSDFIHYSDLSIHERLVTFFRTKVKSPAVADYAQRIIPRYVHAADRIPNQVAYWSIGRRWSIPSEAFLPSEYPDDH